MAVLFGVVPSTVVCFNVRLSGSMVMPARFPSVVFGRSTKHLFMGFELLPLGDQVVAPLLPGGYPSVSRAPFNIVLLAG